MSDYTKKPGRGGGVEGRGKRQRKEK